jgi:hypothetical protein
MGSAVSLSTSFYSKKRPKDIEVPASVAMNIWIFGTGPVELRNPCDPDASG